MGFYTDGPAFDGGTLGRQALGGSETALIQAARNLARRGWRVNVFNNCQTPGIYEGVRYRPIKDFPAVYSSEGFDVFVVSRFHSFFTLPFQAGLKVLWNHDILDRPQDLRAVAGRIDLFFVLSEFHKNNYLTRIPEIAPHTVVTRNGLDFELIDRAAAGAIKNPDKAVYASRPERGLKVLLEDIWPRLHKARPSLILHLCGYDPGTAESVPDLAEQYREIEALADQSPNVVRLGALPKEEYYRHLAESSLMLYPCTFPEISCIAALEAQALRTPIITTDDFALSETVKVREFLTPGRPGRTGYNQEFVSKALYFLDHPERAAELADRARMEIGAEYSWPTITAEWERIFRLSLISRQTNRQAGQPGL